jgi:hypothetical protein
MAFPQKHHIFIMIAVAFLAFALRTQLQVSSKPIEVTIPEPIANPMALAEEVPQFDINMDLPLAERYQELTTYFCPKISHAIPKLVEEIGQLIDEKLGPVGTPFVWALRWKFWFYYHVFMKESTHAEVKYFADRCNIEKGISTLLTYFYDFVSAVASATMCTTVILKDKHGNLLLASNLDFWFNKLLDKVLYKANVYQNGTLIYTSLNVFGINGPLRFWSHVGNYSLGTPTPSPKKIYSNEPKTPRQRLIFFRRTLHERRPNPPTISIPRSPNCNFLQQSLGSHQHPTPPIPSLLCYSRY